MMKAHKIRLIPNNKQRTYFVKASGCARFAYNWGLAEWNKQYEAWKGDGTLTKPSEGLLRKQFNAVKSEQCPFVLEVSKSIPQEALRQLGRAFNCFFKGGVAYPKPRRKKASRDRFYLGNDAPLKVVDRKVLVSKRGWVRVAEPLRFSGRIMSATISRAAENWYISILVDTDTEPDKIENQEIVGVDLGIKTLAALSNGEAFPNPKALKSAEHRLRRLHRSVSRKKKGSANRKKAIAKLAKAHKRVANVRKDAIHKMTTILTRTFGVIGIEDLNAAGMVKNRHLAKAVSDVSFGEVRRQLTYKSNWYGNKLVIADRFFPSSKICSGCGHKREKLTLAEREFVCPECGLAIDRDLNAAINLENYARKLVGPVKRVRLLSEPERLCIINQGR